MILPTVGVKGLGRTQKMRGDWAPNPAKLLTQKGFGFKIYPFKRDTSTD